MYSELCDSYYLLSVKQKIKTLKIFDTKKRNQNKPIVVFFITINQKWLIPLFLRLKNVAIQHVHKQESLEKLMDRELQSKFTEEIISSSQRTNGIIDVQAFLDCLADKPKTAKFFNHRTKTPISGLNFVFVFLSHFYLK